MTGNPWWRDNAACRDEPDKDIFFPGSGETGAEAKAVCAHCPVRAECLAEALRTGDGGVRGGLSERERQKLTKGVA